MAKQKVHGNLRCLLIAETWEWANKNCIPYNCLHYETVNPDHCISSIIGTFAVPTSQPHLTSSNLCRILALCNVYSSSEFLFKDRYRHEGNGGCTWILIEFTFVSALCFGMPWHVCATDSPVHLPKHSISFLTAGSTIRWSGFVPFTARTVMGEESWWLATLKGTCKHLKNLERVELQIVSN